MRVIVFVCLAVALVLANVWFVQWARSVFSREFIIAPFEVVQQHGSDERSSANLARLLNARLGTLQRELRGVRRSSSTTPQTTAPDPSLAATTLFIPQEVVIPTGLLQPIDLNVTVGGVEVGGLLSWLQRTVTKPRTLTFTILDKGEQSIVSADLKEFVDRGNPYLWFESKSSPDEITTNVAYALIQTRLAEAVSSQIATLDLPDFRTLLDSTLRAEALNAKVRQGHVVDREFAALLPELERLSQRVPQWHELWYFIGNVAESSGNRRSAVMYYRRIRRVQGTPGATPVSPAILEDVNRRLTKVAGPAGTAPSAPEEKFVEAASRFADLMALPGDDPAIVFKTPNVPEMQAQWNTEQRRYEVNPVFAETPGLPEYVALMGRFFEKNFDRCMGTDAVRADANFWNEFRHSTVGYLIQSVKEFSNVTDIGSHYPLYQNLKRLDTESHDAMQRLVLEMLWQYDCDWNLTNLPDKVQAINKERGLLPEKVVQQVFPARPAKAGRTTSP